MRRFRAILAAFIATAIPAWVQAQAPGIQLSPRPTRLDLGEAVNLQLVCTNTGVPEAPQAEIPDGLKLELLTATPRSSSFTSIVNGRRSQRVVYTYTLRLTALKEGTHTLGPISVAAETATYQTEAFDIVVRDTESAAEPNGDRFIFAEITVEPKRLYVTQSYTATLTFGIRKVVINGRQIALQMLRDVLDVRNSQLSVFANGKANRSERILTDSAGVRHRYEIFRVAEEVRAEEVGDLMVGPVFLRANYPTRVRRGIFGGYEIQRHRRESARASAVVINVLPPPSIGRPDDYTGAIGAFTLAVTAKPTRLELGQPITLTIALRGSPLDGVAGPDLSRQAELASRFDFVGDELIGDVDSGSKVFRRAVFPKQAGEQTIPPIRWSYFDPTLERYVTLTGEPVNITVDPPSGVSGAAPIALDVSPPGNNLTTLTLLSGGISPNFLDAKDVLADQAFRWTTPWAASLIASPLAWLVVALTSRHRARMKADVNYARRRRAGRAARAALRKARMRAQPTEQLHELSEVLTGYLADRFGFTRGALTPHEVRSLLARNGLDPSVAAKIAGFLESCEVARFAPGVSEELSTARAAKTVLQWIHALEQTGS